MPAQPDVVRVSGAQPHRDDCRFRCPLDALVETPALGLVSTYNRAIYSSYAQRSPGAHADLPVPTPGSVARLAPASPRSRVHPHRAREATPRTPDHAPARGATTRRRRPTPGPHPRPSEGPPPPCSATTTTLRHSPPPPTDPTP